MLYGDCRGFTLLELLLALALGLLVMSMMVLLTGSMTRAYECQQINTELQYTARMCHQVMREDLKEAAAIQVLENGSKIKLLSCKGESIYYYVQNNQLYQQGKAKVPVAENIRSVYFQELAPGLYLLSIRGEIRGQGYALSGAGFTWLSPGGV